MKVYLYKHSFGPFLKLLNDNHIQYQMRETRSMEPMASGGFIELLTSKELWGSLSAIIIAFLKYRNSRKVIITTKDQQIIQASGLSSKDLEKVLENSVKIDVIDTSPKDQ